jgi:hypothetical protein
MLQRLKMEHRVAGVALLHNFVSVPRI